MIANNVYLHYFVFEFVIIVIIVVKHEIFIFSSANFGKEGDHAL